MFKDFQLSFMFYMIKSLKRNTLKVMRFLLAKNQGLNIKSR
jgi:hypothetical protein